MLRLTFKINAPNRKDGFKTFYEDHLVSVSYLYICRKSRNNFMKQKETGHGWNSPNVLRPFYDHYLGLFSRHKRS
jgi:hypothetical protein